MDDPVDNLKLELKIDRGGLVVELTKIGKTGLHFYVTSSIISLAELKKALDSLSKEKTK